MQRTLTILKNIVSHGKSTILPITRLSQRIPNFDNLSKHTKRNFLKKPLWIPSSGSLFIIVTINLLFAFLCRLRFSTNIDGTVIGEFIRYFGSKQANIDNSILLKVLHFGEKISTLSITKSSSIYQVLLDVNFGIGAVIIGLSFFIAQSFLDKDDPYKSRVLLRESMFFPLLVSNILQLVNFIFGEYNFVLVLITIVFAALTIHSLSNSILTLISENKLDVSKKAMLQEILVNSMHDLFMMDVKRRLLNNELIEFNKELDKKYGGKNKSIPFVNVKKLVYESIQSDLEGFLVDINIRNIDILMKRFLLNLRLNSAQVNNADDRMKIVEMANPNPEPLIYFDPKFFRDVSFKTLIAKYDKSRIPSNIYSSSQYIRRIKSVFIIEKTNEAAKEARREFSKLKQKCIQYADTGNYDELKSMLNLYEALIRDNLEHLKKFGGGFSREQALKERTAFPGDRLELFDWLFSDIREIFVFALSSSNIEIIKAVLHVPTSYAMISLDYSDHLYFQTSIQYLTLLFYEGKKRKQLRNFKLHD